MIESVKVLLWGYVAEPTQLSVRALKVDASFDEVAASETQEQGDLDGVNLTDGLVVDGYHHFLIEHLSQGVRVKFDQHVRRISHSSEGVTVRTADGQMYEADYVIVTAPIGVLQRSEEEGVSRRPARIQWTVKSRWS